MWRELGSRFVLGGRLDVARGPEDTHYYLTFGNAWNI